MVPKLGTFGQQVVELREQLGLTQQQLATELGVSFATVNRWENGKTEPSQLARRTFVDFANTHRSAKMPSKEGQKPS